MLIVSDCHLGHFEGVAGYSSEERQTMLCGALQRQREADGVIFAGDLTSRNLTADFSLDCLHHWRRTVMEPLDLPAFAMAASHDSLTDAEFGEVFGHTRHFAVLHGDVAYLCVDTFAGERDASLQTTAADIPPEIAAEMLAAADHARAAFVVCHWPHPGRNFAKLTAHPRVLAVIAGHFHDNRVLSLQKIGIDSDKPLLQTGHFSRPHVKRVADGCGFKPFVPMQSGDFSQTGSPWQYRAVARMPDGIESYQIFPKMCYGAFRSDGIDFGAFTQPYAEGQGDRSYARFAAALPISGMKNPDVYSDNT